MRTQRTRFQQTILITALGLLTATGSVHAEMLLAEPPTMQEAGQLLQEEKWGEAITALRAIIKDDSDNGEALFMLGYALHASGDLDNAILAHKKATKIPEFAAGAFYNLGCAYALKGNASDAFKALDSAIAMGVREKEQFTEDPDLKGLKSDERWRPMLESIEDLNQAETALHFWVGSWDCYDSSTGKLAGNNTIALRVGTGVVHELWISADKTFTGESWNVYNHDTNEWEQTWVDSTGNLLKIEAPIVPEEGAEEFDGLMFQGKNFSPGKKAVYTRMHIRSGKDGHLLQTGFTSKNRGKRWTQSYEYIYVPAGEAFRLETDG